MVQHRWLHSCKVHTHTHFLPWPDDRWFRGTFFGSYRSALQAIQSHLAKQKSQDEKGKGDGKGTQSYRKARGGRKAQGKAQQKSWPKNSNWSPHWKPAEPAVRVEPPWKPPERSVRIDAPREAQRSLCPILGSEIYTGPLWMVKIRVFCRFAGKFPN